MRGRGNIRILAVGLLAALAGGCDGLALDSPPAGILTGRLLVASPRIPDARFANTVILVVHQNARGAMGLVINRGAGRGPIPEILRRVGIESRKSGGEIEVRYGGPVHPETAYVLHSPDYAGEGTVRVSPRVSMSATAKILHELGAGAGPRRALFVLGHAGWGAGELAAEIARKYWVVAPAGEDLVFGANDGTKWTRALIRRGRDL